MQAQTSPEPSNLFLRNDTMLGICEAIGRDLGFHPNWLRVALAAGLLASPEGMIGLYLLLGVAVLASRLLFPDRRPAEPVAAAASEAPAAVKHERADAAPEPVALAA